MDAKRQELYDERTLVNREGKKLAHQIDGMPEYPDAPDLEVSVSELMEELRQREAHNQANNETRDSLNWTNNKVRAQAGRVEEITEQMAQLETELGEAKGKLEQLRQSQSELKSEVTSLQDADVQEVRKQIAGADAINRKVRSNQQRAQLTQLLDDKRVESVSLSATIQDLDEAKAQTLSDATFPIAGLSFNDAGVTYNNIPFDQCSSSEQLRVSLAMGLALNPKLKVLLIRDGSLLDKDNLTMIAEMAAVADAQVWLEKVGEGDDVSIIIEEGMVKE